MELLRTVEDVRAWRDALPAGVKVGMVPTMGYLHEGHLSLLRIAREKVGPAGKIVLTIFVNPTQFGDGEDLDRYPRDEDGDLAKARSEGTDMAFCPDSPEVLYPDGKRTWVTLPTLSTMLCGVARPIHFRGVATVVAKLWNVIRPDYGVFGMKDYQQVAVIRQLHRDLFLPGEVVAGPIVREADGLAMSSRNAYLTEEGRRDAIKMRRFLDDVERRFAAGERVVSALLQGVNEAVAPGRLDYAEIRDAATLQPVERIERPAVCAMATHFGLSRLLDNSLLDPATP